jgi:hypothetical protein
MGVTTALVLPLLLSSQAAAPPLIPSFFTGASLYDICRRPNAGQCSMYVAGVLDGIFFASSQGGDPKLCPARITNRAAAEIATRYLEENPGMRERAAAVGVTQALATSLSCERETERQETARR